MQQIVDMTFNGSEVGDVARVLHVSMRVVAELKKVDVLSRVNEAVPAKGQVIISASRDILIFND